MSVFYAAQFEQVKSFKYDFNKYESIRIIGPFTGKVFARDFPKLESLLKQERNWAIIVPKRKREITRGRERENKNI